MYDSRLEICVLDCFQISLYLSSSGVNNGVICYKRVTRTLEQGVFLFSNTSRPVLRPIGPPMQWGRGDFFGGKAVGA